MNPLATASLVYQALLRQREAKLMKELLLQHRKMYGGALSEISRLIKKSKFDKTQSTATIVRIMNLDSSLRRLESQMQKYIDSIDDVTQRNVEQSIQDGILHGRELVASTVRPEFQGQVLNSFVQGYNPGALEEMMKRNYDTSPVQKALRRIGGDATGEVRQILYQGIVNGKSPYEVADDLREKFAAKYTDAVRLARTETVQAYRESRLESFRPYKEFVPEWQWYTTHDSHTCIACLAMSGRRFSIDEPFSSHPNCRCTPIPVTTLFRDLGIASGSFADEIESGEEWFKKLSRADQKAILKPARYELYRSGEVAFADFAEIHNVKSFGPSLRNTPISRLVSVR